MSLQDEKRAMRSEMARQRQSVTPEVARTAGENAARSIVATQEFQTGQVVAMFASRFDEPDTRPLFELARQREIRVLMPRCRSDRSLDFFWVQAWEDLQPGRYGLLEPEDGPSPMGLDVEGVAGSLGVVVVPGVAFDPRGNRLGRGKGFYDRSLPAEGSKGPMLIGLAFEFQVVDRVPAGSRDRRMDALVTESGFRRREAAGAECDTPGEQDQRIEEVGDEGE
jgi:5-formyltetrahydrofolate cyclo-ligase